MRYNFGLMDNLPHDDNPEQSHRSHHGREHLPPNPYRVGLLIREYKGDLDKRMNFLSDSIKDKKEFYHYGDSVILASNVLANEQDAVTLDESPSAEDLSPSLFEERKLILSQAALLLVHADKDLPGMSELAEICVDRINAIETRLVEPGTKPESITLDTIRENLEIFTAEVKKDSSNPFVKWVRNRSWHLRP